MIIPALPLTPEAFKPYGQVVQGFSLPTSAPKGIHVNIANQGTAFKFHRLAKPAESYAPGLLQKGGIHVGAVKASSKMDIKNGKRIKVELLERHRHTSQAFVPMGAEPGKEGKQGAFVVVAALNGPDDKPDLSTVRAFLATAAQGVNYDEGIWREYFKTCLLASADVTVSDHSLLTVGGVSATQGDVMTAADEYRRISIMPSLKHKCLFPMRSETAKRSFRHPSFMLKFLHTPSLIPLPPPSLPHTLLVTRPTVFFLP